MFFTCFTIAWLTVSFLAIIIGIAIAYGTYWTMRTKKRIAAGLPDTDGKPYSELRVSNAQKHTIEQLAKGLMLFTFVFVVGSVMFVVWLIAYNLK